MLFSDQNWFLTLSVKNVSAEMKIRKIGSLSALPDVSPKIRRSIRLQMMDGKQESAKWKN
jgi:hypothetical protein